MSPSGAMPAASMRRAAIRAPGGVGEGPVVAGGQGGAVPDVLEERPGVVLGWAVEVRGQVVEGRAGPCRVGFRRVPGSDQVRITLLLVAAFAGAVQVA